MPTAKLSDIQGKQDVAPESTDDRNAIQRAFDYLTTVTPEQEKDHSWLFNKAQEFGAGVQSAGTPFVHPLDTAHGLWETIKHPIATSQQAADAMEADPFKAAGTFIGGLDTAGVGESALPKVFASIPTRARGAAMLDKAAEIVNRPRFRPMPKGLLSAPAEEIPLHEQPFKSGRLSRPVILESNRPMQRDFPGYGVNKPEVFSRTAETPGEAVLPDEPSEPWGERFNGMKFNESVGEVPGTRGGKQPLQGVFIKRPAINTEATPLPQPYFMNQVDLNRSLPFLEKAQRLSEEGHGTITPLDNMYRRINTVNPLEYDEARSRYSALGNLTGEDRMRATPTLQRAVKQFHHALGEDIGDTAEKAGAGKEYRQGMKTYRRASQMRAAATNLGNAAKKIAVPAALGAAGYKIYKELQ